MTSWIKRLCVQLAGRFSGDVGQALTEYALILALIALVAVVALALLGGDVSSELTTIGSSFPS